MSNAPKTSKVKAHCRAQGVEAERVAVDAERRQGWSR